MDTEVPRDTLKFHYFSIDEELYMICPSAQSLVVKMKIRATSALPAGDPTTGALTMGDLTGGDLTTWTLTTGALTAGALTIIFALF